jgi:hypothetical protein
LVFYGKMLKDEKHLITFMKHLNECFTTKINPRTKQPIGPIDIEAFFHIMELNSVNIAEFPNFSAVVVKLLLEYVKPELDSPHGFMRMRACKMVSCYAGRSLAPEVLIQLSQGVGKCMEDKDLPVRSCAAQALEVLLQQPDLRSHFLPDLKRILTIYIKLINEFESDGLIESLKAIFEMYSDVIGPYAYDLVANLVALFQKCIEKEQNLAEDAGDQSENEKEMVETGFAGQGCLVAIEEVLRSKIEISVLISLYPVTEPIFTYVFSEDGIDFLAEGLSILNQFVHKLPEIPETLWGYFSILTYSLTGKPTGQFPNFCPGTSQNVISIFNSMETDVH